MDKPAKNKKWSTTSNVYLDSTISKPNVNAIITSVATILHSQMLEDMEEERELNENSDLFYFSEEKYIKEKPEEYDEQRKELLREMPTVESISEFMKALFECAQFSIECCIICLVYINRIISLTEMPLQPTNWRPLILCSLLVAQKVLDDKYLSNSDFAFIYPFFTNEEVNRLEAKFLELLNFNVTVKSQVYTRYYFELRALFKGDNDFPLQPLTVDQCKDLEVKSGDISSQIKEGKPLSKTCVGGQIQSKAKVVLS